ncbi:hypothetical protein HK098_005293 [Nowakowskiella sp. JEL0407]|nr:hypothetical protein HK098_005293 [Nowakowskiella sp. JEL0407]
MERKGLIIFLLYLLAPTFTFATYSPVKCIYRSDVSPTIIPANPNLEVRESCRNICLARGSSQFLIEYGSTTNCLCGDYQAAPQQTCGKDTVEVYQIFDDNEVAVSPNAEESATDVTESASDYVEVALGGAGASSGSGVYAEASPQPVFNNAQSNSTDKDSDSFSTLPIGVMVAIGIACLVALALSIFGAVYFKKKKSQVYPSKTSPYKNDCEAQTFTPAHIQKLAQCASEPVSSLHRAASSLRTSKSDKTTKRLTSNTIYSEMTFPQGFLYRTNSQTSIQSAFFPLDNDENVPPVPQVPVNEPQNMGEEIEYQVESYVEVSLEEAGSNSQSLSPTYATEAIASHYETASNVSYANSSTSGQAVYGQSQISLNTVSEQSNVNGRC